jgi:hypothetical protein
VSDILSELIPWLTEQLDQDEKVARAARPDRHRAIVTEVLGTGALGAHLQARHVAEWDPARVLAEIDAKRRIIALTCDGADGGYPSGYYEAKTDVICLLALPYAHRPGYREEWKP